MLASEALNLVLRWRSGEGPLSDDEMTADCEKCGEPVSLGACRVESLDGKSVYRCGRCSDLLLIVEPFVEGTKPWKGRAYGFGGWRFRNTVLLVFRGLGLPACQFAALDDPEE